MITPRRNSPPLRSPELRRGDPEKPSDILRVEGLVKHFPIRRGVLRRQVGWVRAVDGLDFGVAAGQTLSLVGESGCGKSTTGRLLARLIEPTAGRVWLESDELTALPPARLRSRRRDIQIMFQDPFSSLSPRFTVAEIIAEPLRVQGLYRSGGRNRVLELLDLVGLRPEHAYRYPHEFSGGQRQRIGLARALALEPKVLILDEPVSALDVSVQAQVVNQLQDLQQRLGLAYVFISHNLSVVRHLSDRIAVMYLGMIVEQGSREQLYQRPRHPYTKALLSAVPVPDPDRRDDRDRIRLTGEVPSVSNPPSGCRFRTRCWKAQDVCASTPPPLAELTADGHLSACHFPENVDPATSMRTTVESPDQER